MSKKPDSKPAYGYCGYLEVMPLSKGSSSSQLNESAELQIKDRYSYKDAYGEGGSSSFTASYKAGEFVDKSTGGLGYRQEANYTSTDKYVDKEIGFTTEYQTQVKFKKSVYPNKTQVKFKKSASPYKSGTKSYNNRVDYY